MPPDWRMTLYDLALSEAPIDLPGDVHRFIYVHQGRAMIDTDGTKVEVQSGEGAFISQRSRIAGEGNVWIYEVGPDGRQLLAAPDLSIVLSRRFPLDLAPAWLLRADRIESTPGSATPRHGHRGPGMRRLIKGRLQAEIGDSIERIDAGHAWFESGLEPVIGTNTHSENSAFVRVMVLPMELEGGKSSFVPTTPQDAAKPRAVANRLFGEVVMTTAKP